MTKETAIHLNVIEGLSIPLNPYNCVLMLGSMWSSSLEIGVVLTKCLAFKGEDFFQFENPKDDRRYFLLLCSDHVCELPLAQTLQLC